jgi:hypothetical protein
VRERGDARRAGSGTRSRKEQGLAAGVGVDVVDRRFLFFFILAHAPSSSLSFSLSLFTHPLF